MSWIAQEPDRAAGQCPQSRCSTRSPAATTWPHHRRDEGKTSLVGRVGPDKIQTLCVRVSLRKRHCSTISNKAMRSGLHNVGTVEAALGGHRWTLGPFLQAPRLSVRGLSPFRVRVLGTLFQQNFASLDSVCPRLRGIWRLNCSDQCYCHDWRLDMMIWLMICSTIIVFRICTLYTLNAITMPWDILECM